MPLLFTASRFTILCSMWTCFRWFGQLFEMEFLFVRAKKLVCLLAEKFTFCSYLFVVFTFSYCCHVREKWKLKTGRKIVVKNCRVKIETEKRSFAKKTSIWTWRKINPKVQRLCLKIENISLNRGYCMFVVAVAVLLIMTNLLLAISIWVWIC